MHAYTIYIIIRYLLMCMLSGIVNYTVHAHCEDL